MSVKIYSELDYTAAEYLDINEVKIPDTKYARISIPTNETMGIDLVNKGYLWVDRTVEVKVPVANSKIDFNKFCRMEVHYNDSSRDRIREIAKTSFDMDYRFRVTMDATQSKLREAILDAWIDEQKSIFKCIYKDMVVGFADVRFLDEYGSDPFIYLAAVEEKYRAAGAAMSLYAGVFKYYSDKVRSVYGRISTKNMAVMNLYAKFGAQFSQPYDIYIKKTI